MARRLVELKNPVRRVPRPFQRNCSPTDIPCVPQQVSSAVMLSGVRSRSGRTQSKHPYSRKNLDCASLMTAPCRVPGAAQILPVQVPLLNRCNLLLPPPAFPLLLPAEGHSDAIVDLEIEQAGDIVARSEPSIACCLCCHTPWHKSLVSPTYSVPLRLPRM